VSAPEVLATQQQQKWYKGNNHPVAEKNQSMPAEEVVGRQQCSEVIATESLKVRVSQNLTINQHQ